MDRQQQITYSELPDHPSAALISEYEGYLQKLSDEGYIEQDGAHVGALGRPLKWKITTRPDEGDMSFASMFSTLVRGPRSNDPYGVSLEHDQMMSLVINNWGSLAD